MWNSSIFFQENTFQNVVCEMAAIFNVLILFYFCTQFLIYWNDKNKLKVIIDQFVFTY